MIQGILLAAGQSQRFGSNKLLQRVEGGMPMAVVSALKLKQHVDQLLVIIKPGDNELRDIFNRLEIETLTCEHSWQGMGNSISCAIKATHNASAWILALADMPYIQSDTIATLVNMMRIGAAISAPMQDARRGHPVGFNQKFLDHLLLLNGDQGAREIINTHSNEFVGFSTQDKGIHLDIDQPSDLQLH